MSSATIEHFSFTDAILGLGSIRVRGYASIRMTSFTSGDNHEEALLEIYTRHQPGSDHYASVGRIA